MHSSSFVSDFSFLPGGGEMGSLIRSYEWHATEAGPPEHWPPVLRTSLSIILHNKIPMMLCWGDRAICFYNEACASLLQRFNRHPFALGRESSQAWPEMWEVSAPKIEEILAGGEPLWEEHVTLAYGQAGPEQRMYLNCSYSPVFDEGGRPRGVLLSCIETTETVVMIEELYNSNEKAKLAIEAADLGVVEVDLVTEDVSISKRIEEIFGLPSGTERSAFLRQMHPDDLLVRSAAYERAYKEGRLEYESRVFQHNGAMRWIKLKGTVFTDANQKPLKMLAVVQDITEQKEFSSELTKQVKERTEDLELAHHALLASNAYLQDIINVFNSPLQVLEPVMENGEVKDFVYKLTNEAYAAYAGKQPGDLAGKRVSDIFPGYFETDSFRNIREVALTGAPKLWENHYVADGLNIYNEMGAVNMNGDVVVHMTDFTKLKQLQWELIRQNDELKRSNANLEEFAYAASHDLKEPIRKIQYFTGELRFQLGDRLDEGQQRSFERIANASKRMGHLIDDLLTYSHVSHRLPQKEAVDLGEKLERILEDYELAIRERDAQVEVGTMPVVEGHKRQLQQLFQNLLGNALKYSKPGVRPRIEVRATVTEEQGTVYHVISVSDNGIGFPQQYADKIFQMFTRLHGRSEYNGNGMGLSIAKKVAENHQGFIRVESEPGQGSTFKVYLPASDPDSLQLAGSR